jgi:DNA-directed RNA polymerase II subunit RPB2
MTIAQIIECLVGKNAALRRQQADGTPFEERDLEDVKSQLAELGYHPNGIEEMYNGFTGRKMNIPIFIGPTFYCRLKHMVEDKIHGRARGPKQQLTHQALEGRSRDGGLRVGEMERDALIAHGMSRFIKEKLMDSSDPYATFVCGKCGLFAQRNKKPTSEREPSYNDVYWCEKCNNFSDIHRVMLPYACKLLFQELMALGVASRIRIDRPVHHPNYNDN